MFSRESDLEKLVLDEEAKRASRADLAQGVERSKVTWQRAETTERGSSPIECLN